LLIARRAARSSLRIGPEIRDDPAIVDWFLSGL
jgi:hypothetical protein